MVQSRYASVSVQWHARVVVISGISLRPGRWSICERQMPVTETVTMWPLTNMQRSKPNSNHTFKKLQSVHLCLQIHTFISFSFLLLFHFCCFLFRLVVWKWKWECNHTRNGNENTSDEKRAGTPTTRLGTNPNVSKKMRARYCTTAISSAVGTNFGNVSKHMHHSTEMSKSYANARSPFHLLAFEQVHLLQAAESNLHKCTNVKHMESPKHVSHLEDLLVQKLAKRRPPSPHQSPNLQHIAWWWSFLVHHK